MDYNAGYDQPTGYSQPGQLTNVAVQQPNTFTVVTEEPAWSWCSLVISFFTMCCCPLFGMIAMVLSVLGYVDHKVKHFASSKSKVQVSYGIGIAGLILGIIFCVILPIVIVVTALNKEQSYGGY